MKTRFNTYDIVCVVTELQKLIGMRVNQIYDIDNKTYLIRLQRTEEKVVLLLESGNRLHTTAFEWPKNVAPSGFTMKLRKHLKNKRLETLTQIGTDRIVDLQFGTGEAAYHVILELYDRGNILLCDHELTILNVLRPHAEGEEIRFAVREKYPMHRAKTTSGKVSEAEVREVIENAQPGSALRTILNPILNCGPSVIDHVLLKRDLLACKVEGKKVDEAEQQQPVETGKKRKQKQKDSAKYGSKEFSMEKDLPGLMEALEEAHGMMQEALSTCSKGFIIQKEEKRPTQSGGEESFYVNVEYHPFLFHQFSDKPFREFDSYNAAVDEFHSTLEGQKIDLKAMQQERDALKKLSNVRTDHAKRIEELTKTQFVDRDKAELITRNQELVDKAILAIQSALANQMSWPDIQELVKVAQAKKDPVALIIKQLKMEVNSIALQLTDPYSNPDNEDSDEDEEETEKLETMVIDVDLSLSAFANARRYYDQKRNAARKEQKTIESSGKALKSAERRTQQTLKEVKTMTNISKARKVYWFEKFYWFISSENYLVIGGRDQQQNELIVKRYMRPSDIYVHAEIQGASSVVIRNPSGGEVPPKTLLEAGTMAICYSVAWDAKVVTNAYWVKSEQVSKTAPTGEYLGTGSFMIRGKKNFLPPCQLVLGLSFLFRLEDGSVERHRGERRVRQFGEDDESLSRQTSLDTERLSSISEDVEIELEKDDEEGEEKDSESSDDEVKYPDTHVKVEHDTGRITLKADAVMERLKSIEEEPENTIFLGDDKPYIIPANPRPPKKKQQQNKKKGHMEPTPEPVESKDNQQSDEEDSRGENKAAGQMKRGQKGKLKKMKKYKDQDEDERKAKMEILKSDGRGAKEKKKKQQEEEMKKYQRRNVEARKPREPAEGEEVDETPAAADVDMLDFLTGAPVEEDELLFAVPVIAPYQTLHNYKFKVKLTPGTGRRGKASKTAVLMFQKDKTCSTREKDLLKSVKEEMIARNIPGKVKLSAPQLQKFKK
ncbi:Nuclear export mediator factor NEMF homolog [Sergentomyia squamirostris]